MLKGVLYLEIMHVYKREPPDRWVPLPSRAANTNLFQQLPLLEKRGITIMSIAGQSSSMAPGGRGPLLCNYTRVTKNKDIFPIISLKCHHPGKWHLSRFIPGQQKSIPDSSWCLQLLQNYKSAGCQSMLRVVVLQCLTKVTSVVNNPSPAKKLKKSHQH